MSQSAFLGLGCLTFIILSLGLFIVVVAVFRVVSNSGSFSHIPGSFSHMPGSHQWKYAFAYRKNKKLIGSYDSDWQWARVGNGILFSRMRESQRCEILLCNNHIFGICYDSMEQRQAILQRFVPSVLADLILQLSFSEHFFKKLK